MAQTLQHAVYIARSILERAQCIVYERRSAGGGRTIHIYKQIARTCLVYVGLAPEEVRQGQKVNVISFSLPTSGMVFSRSLGDF